LLKYAGPGFDYPHLHNPSCHLDMRGFFVLCFVMKVQCEACGTTVDRKDSEIRRSQRLGRRTFCSLRCSGSTHPPKAPPTGTCPPQFRPNNRRDKYSPFRQHLISIRSRSKSRNQIVEVTLEDLKQLWERQDGICPVTGWKMDNLQSTSDERIKHPRRASLDRIDSSKSYTKDNIRFVCWIVNCAKNEFDNDVLLEFCQAVVDNATRRSI